MTSADIGILGQSAIANGVITWQVNVPVGNDNEDVEPCGEVDVMQGLGLASMPFPKTAEGYAEALMLRDCGGKDVVCVGARDTRNAELVGKMKPGDTTLHSTGPGSVAQCFLKHEKKQAGLATDDVTGKTMMFLLDGKNKKAQLTARGAMIQIDEDGSILIVEKGGAGIKLQDGKIFILGDLVLPGMTPGFVLAQMAPAGQPPGPAAVLLTPLKGVSG